MHIVRALRTFKHSTDFLQPDQVLPNFGDMRLISKNLSL